MNHATELLIVLVFFVPMVLMVGMNLFLYREGRYTIQPPAPRMAASEAPAEASNDFEHRKAA